MTATSIHFYGQSGICSVGWDNLRAKALVAANANQEKQRLEVVRKVEAELAEPAQQRHACCYLKRHGSLSGCEGLCAVDFLLAEMFGPNWVSLQPEPPSTYAIHQRLRLTEVVFPPLNESFASFGLVIAGRVNKHGPTLAPNMESKFQNVLVQKLASFLNEIGLEVVPGALAGETFLPGIEVEAGRLIVDETQLLHPGDLLHEAGHLAVMPPKLRHSLQGELLDTGEDMTLLEVAAIAWSYAACVHLEIDPQVVFHPAGYKGKAAALLISFQYGVYPGANQLQAAGLTLSPEQALELGLQSFPKMVKWVRD